MIEDFDGDLDDFVASMMIIKSRNVKIAVIASRCKQGPRETTNVNNNSLEFITNYLINQEQFKVIKQNNSFMMIALVDAPVLPGFRVEEAIVMAKSNKKVVLGPGLRQDKDDAVLVCKSGVLRKKTPNTFWVDCYQKRYVPNRSEIVVGIVTQKAGDIFRVDIGGSEPASLSYLAFEGATKKNRPDVNVGDAICARLLIANRDLEPELICVDSHGKKGKLGVLQDGFVFNCSINLVRKILNPKCVFLDLLAKEMAFEMAAGMNGRIWIKGKTVKETIAVGNAILAVEFKSNDELKELCDDIGSYVAGFS